MNDYANPTIRALAREASEKIKSLTDAHNAQIEAVYQDFRTKAEAANKEANTEGLQNSSVGSSTELDKLMDNQS